MDNVKLFMVFPVEMKFPWSVVLHFVFSGQFVIGILCGFLLAALFTEKSMQESRIELKPVKYLSGTRSRAAREPIKDTRQKVGAKDVSRRDRILCWVVTAPANKFKAEMVNNTWGQRCDKLLFISSQNDSSLPSVAVPIHGPESREQLWNKAKFTLHYVYNNHLNDYDWFFKADDDTYTIMENLREYLSTLDPTKPHFLGRRFKEFLSGGAGYVFSRSTIQTLVEKGLDTKSCEYDIRGSADDYIIGLCLTKLGIQFGDTRDDCGHQRFIPYNVEEFYSNTGANMDFIRGEYGDYYPFEKGCNCCSNRAITFHYISGYRMQMYEYLIYKLKIANKTV